MSIYSRIFDYVKLMAKKGKYLTSLGTFIELDEWFFIEEKCLGKSQKILNRKTDIELEKIAIHLNLLDPITDKKLLKTITDRIKQEEFLRRINSQSSTVKIIGIR